MSSITSLFGSKKRIYQYGAGTYTWTPVADANGCYRVVTITICGAGGSGSVGSSTTPAGKAGGNGYVLRFALLAATQLTFVVGAGGAIKTSSSTSGASGNPGGNTLMKLSNGSTYAHVQGGLEASVAAVGVDGTKVGTTVYISEIGAVAGIFSSYTKGTSGISGSNNGSAGHPGMGGGGAYYLASVGSSSGAGGDGYYMIEWEE